MSEQTLSEKTSHTGTVLGKLAPDFSLRDQNNTPIELFRVLEEQPALLVFYPKDFTLVCTKQLCGYRDNFEEFAAFGVRLLAVSANTVESHAQFAKENDFAFTLLSDPGHVVAKTYQCRSPFMLGAVSRAIVIVNQKRFMIYRYVEPTILTHRNATELLGVLSDLRENGLLS